MAFVNAVALAPPLWLEESSVYQAKSLRRLVRIVSRGSAGVVGAGDLAVSPTGPASMDVGVAAGDAIGQSPDSSEGSYIATVAPTGAQVTVPAADGSNPRNDILAVQILDSDYQGTVLQGNVGIIQGTPAASPTDPTIPTDALYIPLARIPVPAAATAISAAVDLRGFANLGLSGSPVVTTSYGPPSSGFFRPGDMALDSLGNMWAFVGAGGLVSGWSPLSSRIKLLSQPFNGSFAFNPVPQYFRHLHVEGIGFGPGGGPTNDDLSLQFNGDTSASYVEGQFYVQGVSLYGTAMGYSGAQTSMPIAQLTGTALNSASFKIDIPFYSTPNFNRTARGHSAHIEGWSSANNVSSLIRDGWWISTAAISSILFKLASPLTSGQIDIYGEL